MDESQKWRIAVGSISVHGPGAELERLYAELALDATWESEPPLPTVRTICCPVCGADRDLVATGRWGSDALLLCPTGHEWTETVPLAGGLTLMQRLIQAAQTTGEPMPEVGR